MKTELYLHLDHDVDSAKSKVGDRVASRLESPVVVHGRDVVPTGTKFDLRVTNSQIARENWSVGLLTLEVDSFSLNGRKYPVTASALTEQTKPLPVSVTAQRVLPFVTTEPARIGG